MNMARVLVNGVFAGMLEKIDNSKYRFTYENEYQGAPVSLTMPINNHVYEYDTFPPFFEGVLPEGDMLEALLRKYKIDRKDYFNQLIAVGQDLVGAVTVEGIE